MPPCLLSAEGKNRREQSAQCVENFIHHHLCRPTKWGVCRVAIHPVLRDIDVEAAQIHGTKLVERVINLVELECFISGSTSANRFIESLENPAVDKRIIPLLGFLVSRFKIV